jgi:hypothetical protein
MGSDRVATNIKHRARELLPRGDAAPSGDAMAHAFAERYGAECGYVGPGHRWVTWARKRWIQDSRGSVFALIRKLAFETVRPRSARPPLWHAPPPTLLAPGWNNGVDSR